MIETPMITPRTVLTSFLYWVAFVCVIWMLVGMFYEARKWARRRAEPARRRPLSKL